MIKEGQTLYLRFVRFISIGLPRSGKTTFWRRLVKEIQNIMKAREKGEKEEPSTGLARLCGEILIREAMSVTGIISPDYWSILDNDAEVNMLLQFFSEITDTLLHNEFSHDSTAPAHISEGSTVLANSEQNLPQPKPDLPTPPAVEKIMSSDQMIPIIRKAMKSDSWDQIKYKLEEIILLISTDTGGHAEFLDLYAALISGPSFSLLFSSLTDELNKKFKVYFTDENSESTTEEFSDLTVEEVMLQALSSIACFSNSFCACDDTSPKDASAKATTVREISKSFQSKVMFVGTHKDLVSNEELAEKDKLLLQKIQGTEFYQKGIIEHYHGSQLMLAVDNMHGDEDEIDRIRSRFVDALSSLKKIPIPASWLMLNLVIRSEKRSIMSLKSCEDLAEKLDISQEELQHALWFLHHIVGALLYYPEVDELKDTVICSVGVMYNCITNFVKAIYKSRKSNWQAYDRFRKWGELSLKQLEVATADAPISQKNLLKLLNYLHIITTSPQSPSTPGESIYFMPCMLKSARADDLTVPVPIDGKPPSLMLRYKCGYTPVGVFPAMITNLVSRNQELGWNLIRPSTGLLKNRVEFRVGDDRDKVYIISHFHYFEIAISRNQLESYRQTTESVCDLVRGIFTDTLKTVTSRMNYNFRMDYQYGFECPTHPGKEHVCVMNTDTAQCMECIQEPEHTPIPLKPHHKLWFSKGTGDDDDISGT